MKRVLWGLLAAMLMVFLLAGCMVTESKDETAATIEKLVNLTIDGKEATLNEDSDITIGIVMAGFDNTGWIAIFTGIIDEAIRQHVGVACFSADNDPNRQIVMVNNLIARSVDAIIFIPTNSERLSVVVKAAQESDIPIVAADRSIVNAMPDALVESDNIKIGQTAADEMFKLSGGQELRILVLQGDLMTSAGYERDHGFQEEIKQYSNCTVVESCNANWKADIGYNAVLEAFKNNPDIDAIYLPSDLYTQGTVAALEILGKLKPVGHPQHIIIVTVDGHPVGLENLRKEYIDIDVGQRLFSVGQTAMESCIHLAKGETPDQKIIRMQPQVINRDNVDSEELWGNFIG